MRPAISVIMPIYNTQAFLHEAIESIQKQTFKDWELLCLDDGSSDESLAIAQKFVSKDRRIHTIAGGRCGLVATLNRGFAAASGTYLARMDGDDISEPDRLALQLAMFLDRPSVGIVVGGYASMDLNGSTWKTQAIEDDHPTIVRKLQHSNCIAHGTVMMRREVVDALRMTGCDGPYRANFPFAEDYDLWLRASCRLEFGSVMQSVLRYRRNLQQLDPEKIAKQVTSTIGVQLANGLIATNRPVPELPNQVDFAWLLCAGLDKKFINRQICRRLLSEARDSQRFGNRAQAKTLIRASFKYRPQPSEVAASVDYLYRIAKTIVVRSAMRAA